MGANSAISGQNRKFIFELLEINWLYLQGHLVYELIVALGLRVDFVTMASELLLFASLYSTHSVLHTLGHYTIE